MNAFFDNCTSPTLAATVAGFVAHLGVIAVHIRDAAGVGLRLRRDADDLDWIAALSADSREWVVVTGDRRLTATRRKRKRFDGPG